VDPGQPPEPIEQGSFPFAAHGAEAAVEYRGVRDFYSELAGAVQSVVAQCLKDRGVPIHRVESRAKEVESFQAKASSPSENDPEVPKYQDPLNEIRMQQRIGFERKNASSLSHSIAAAYRFMISIPTRHVIKLCSIATSLCRFASAPRAYDGTA
jgi:hypothetical protein